MQPKVALSYASSPRSDSWVGYGWQLGFGAIQRSLKEGVPAYDDDLDTFVLDGSELVEVGAPGSNEYRTKRESFLRITRDPINDTWEVRRKDGTVLRYGASSDPGTPRTRQSSVLAPRPSPGFSRRSRT
jgi:hypothetical protein